MAGCRRIELLYPPWQGGVLAAERTPQNKTHSNSARFERAWPARVNRASHWFSVNNVSQITLQLRVFGGEWGIWTPGGFYTPSAFKADAINRTLPTLQKNLDALFCFSHITKLAKTSHTCRCSPYMPLLMYCRIWTYIHSLTVNMQLNLLYASRQLYG